MASKTVTVKVQGIVALALLMSVVAAGTIALSRPMVADAAGPPAAKQAERQRPTRTDRFGDPLPPGAVARIGTIRLRAKWGTGSLAFSPDGKVLAMGDDEFLRFWDVANGKEIRHFNPRIYQVNVLAFSPDGKYLAVGGGGGMGAWEVSTAKRLSHLKGQYGHTDVVAFSPDGRILVAGGYGNTIHVWEVTSGKELRQFFPPGSHTERPGGLGSIRGVVQDLHFSPDGRTLFSRNEDPDQAVTTLQRWDMTTGKERGKAKRYSIKTPLGSLYFVLCSPDGRLALIPSKDRLTVLNLDSGVERRLPLERPHERLLAFTPDSKRFVSWSEKDKQIHLRNIDSGKQQWQLSCPYELAPKLTFSPDGKTLAAGGSSPSALRFWDVARGKEFSPLGTVPDSISAIAFLPDGKTLISASPEGRIRWWTAETGKEVRRLDGSLDGISVMALSADGKTLAATDKEKELWLWKLPEGKVKRRVAWKEEGEDRWRKPWALSPNGEILAYSDKKGTAVLVEAATGKEIRRIDHAGQVRMFSPQGPLLVTSGQRGTVDLWDAATGTLWRRLGSAQTGKKFWDFPACLSFSPDGKNLSMVWIGHIGANGFEIWDVARGRRLPHFEKGRQQLHGWVNGVCFSADGKTVLLRVENRDEVAIRAFDRFNAKEVGKLPMHKNETPNTFRGGPQTLFPSPNGRLLATLEWGSPILIWDIARLAAPPRKARELSAADMAALWSDLGADDLAKAYDALGQFVDAPAASVKFLQEHMRAVEAVEERRLQQLLADLDSDHFETRAKAERELEKMEELAEPVLRRALRERPSSLEQRRRIEGLLKRLEGPITSADTLRQLRAVEVLEHIGSTEARQVLRTPAEGAPEALLTREAKAALERLRHRSSTAP
ncbi:MAG TPA: hypothetical protein VMG10_34330 [Gemmataceae bacterium]|nr:hypothetical protein [Gemmataceae bacterium]